jgi:hypothetical protein
MPWREAHQIQIFAPATDPYRENWVEQILGTTVKPVYEQYPDDIRWMWVTRYVKPYDEEHPPGGSPLPKTFRLGRYCRYIWFRVSVARDSRQEILSRALRLATDAGCHTHPEGWIDFPIVADLGSNRFIRAQAVQHERARRAELVVRFVDATVKLMLDLLTKAEDGSWHFEPSTHDQNPKGSVFESVHHLFCNATQVPTTVLLSEADSELRVRTYWMQWLDVSLEPNTVHEVSVKY